MRDVVRKRPAFCCVTHTLETCWYTCVCTTLLVEDVKIADSKLNRKHLDTMAIKNHKSLVCFRFISFYYSLFSLS